MSVVNNKSSKNKPKILELFFVAFLRIQPVSATDKKSGRTLIPSESKSIASINKGCCFSIPVS